MLRLSGLCGCAAIAVASSGCLSMTIDARELQPAVHVSGVHAQGEAQPLQTFEASTHGTWLFWGLVVRSDPQLGGELSRVLTEAGGDGVRALTIVTQQTFMDGLVAVLTLGIYGRRTTFLRGSIVRTQGEATGSTSADGVEHKRKDGHR